jgi:hypothetical protein
VKKNYTIPMTTGELAILVIAAKTNYDNAKMWLEEEKKEEVANRSIPIEDLEGYAKDSRSLLRTVVRISDLAEGL